MCLDKLTTGSTKKRKNNLPRRIAPDMFVTSLLSAVYLIDNEQFALGLYKHKGKKEIKSVRQMHI